jgi:nudix-type nucleoside diphosphatase (YffH/AdpP family)
MTDDQTYWINKKTLLARNWGTLTKYDFDLKTSSGEWQQQSREVYDHGDGVACLLHDELEDTVLLIRQFRLPAAINGNIAYPIEAPAGVLDGIDPEIRMQRELEEETGYRAQILSPLSTIYMSPGSFTERIHLFTGIYDRHAPVSGGGGNAHEGEDIEVSVVRDIRNP